MSIEDQQADIVGVYNGLSYLSIVYPMFKITQDDHNNMMQLMQLFADAYDKNVECSDQEKQCLREADDLCKLLTSKFIETLSTDISPKWNEEFVDMETIDVISSLWEDISQLKYTEIYSLYVDIEGWFEPLQFSLFEEFKQHLTDDGFNINFIRIVTDGYDLEYGEGW